MVLPLLLVTLAIVSVFTALFLNGNVRLAPDATHHAAVGKSIEYTNLDPLLHADTPLRADDLSGHVTLLHFWGPWCPPCVMEYPELVELYHSTREQTDFRFVSISCIGYPGQSQDDLQTMTEEFYEANDFNVPTYFDTEYRLLLKASTTLEQEGLMFPTTVIVDPEGEVAAVWQGYHQTGVQEMRAVINDLLQNNDSI